MLPEIQKHWQDKRISLHVGSIEALISFLVKHQAWEVCLKSVVSPTQSLRGDSVRHYAVCVSACLYGEPGTPIAYATFLAAIGAWSGKHTRILYPPFAADDPLRVLPIQEAIRQFQHALFFAVQQALQENSAFSIVSDVQWDVPDAWVSLAKGFTWHAGQWERQESSPASTFTIS